VINRLFCGIKIGFKDTNIQEYPAVYIIDSHEKCVTGPYTTEQFKIIALEKRAQFPKMSGTKSEVIEELDTIKQNPNIKTIIVLDYVNDDRLMWYIVSDIKRASRNSIFTI